MCILQLFVVFSAFSFVAVFLQYSEFDTVGWIFWPVKTVSPVLAGTLNHAQSNPL